MSADDTLMSAYEHKTRCYCLALGGITPSSGAASYADLKKSYGDKNDQTSANRLAVAWNERLCTVLLQHNHRSDHLAVPRRHKTDKVNTCR